MTIARREALVLVERHGACVLLTLNRPKARNALSGDMLADLVARLSELGNADDVGAVFVRGQGGYFCAGGDVKERRALRDAGRHDELVARSAEEGRLLSLIARLPQATVAVVEGGAVGAGVGMISACDLAICTVESRFSMPEIDQGFAPLQSAPHLVSAVGRRNAAWLLLGGRTFNAADAAALGLVHELVAGNMGETLARLLGEWAGRDAAQLHATMRALGSPTLPDEADIASAASLHVHLAGSGER